MYVCGSSDIFDSFYYVGLITVHRVKSLFNSTVYVASRGKLPTSTVFLSYVIINTCIRIDDSCITGSANVMVHYKTITISNTVKLPFYYSLWSIIHACKFSFFCWKDHFRGKITIYNLNRPAAADEQLYVATSSAAFYNYTYFKTTRAWINRCYKH